MMRSRIPQNPQFQHTETGRPAGIPTELGYETLSVPSAATSKVVHLSSRLRKLHKHSSLMPVRAALARMEPLNPKLLLRSMA